MSTVYSFKDTAGTYTNPVAGAFLFAGQIGMNQAHVTMATEKTTHTVAADGTVMITYIAGDNGSIAIEVQQTSDAHKFFLEAYNTLKALADQGNITSWGAGAITLRNLLDGSMHVATGVSFPKIPDKVYAAQGQNITWNLMCADIQNI